MSARIADERDVLIARLEQENAQLVERLARLRPALHGLTEDLVRAHRDTAEWRRRYRDLASRGEPSSAVRRPSGGDLMALRDHRDAA